MLLLLLKRDESEREEKRSQLISSCFVSSMKEKGRHRAGAGNRVSGGRGVGPGVGRQEMQCDKWREINSGCTYAFVPCFPPQAGGSINLTHEHVHCTEISAPC